MKAPHFPVNAAPVSASEYLERCDAIKTREACVRRELVEASVRGFWYSLATMGVLFCVYAVAEIASLFS